MELRNWPSVDLTEIQNVVSDSPFIYLISCILTVAALYIAWKLTVSSQRTSLKENRSILINKQSNRHKKKPTATCKPVQACRESGQGDARGTTADDDDDDDIEEINRVEDGEPRVDPLQYTQRRVTRDPDLNDHDDLIIDPDDINYVEDGGPLHDIDPVSYSQHIQSQVKKLKSREMWKDVEKEMTVDDKKKELDIQRQQMEAIFKLMETQKEKFGMDDPNEVEEQMKLYM